MQEGHEMSHLKEMMRRLSIWGTEIKLLFQDTEHSEVPYPAYRWLFRKAFSFRWKDPSIHINVGELAMLSWPWSSVEQASHKSMALAIWPL